MLWWWCGFLNPVETSVLLLDIGKAVISCWVVPRRSSTAACWVLAFLRASWTKKQLIAPSSCGSGRYYLFLRTCVYRAWQAYTKMEETLPLMLRCCSCIIRGSVSFSSASRDFPPQTHIIPLLRGGSSSSSQDFKAHWLLGFVLSAALYFRSSPGTDVRCSQQRPPCFQFSVARNVSTGEPVPC